MIGFHRLSMPGITTGVNDVEHLTLDEVIQKQLEMVDTARKAFLGKKIIVSSVTPRDDDFDETFGQ